MASSFLLEIKSIISEEGLNIKNSKRNNKEKPFPEREGSFAKIYHLRLRAASAFFLRLTLGFS